MSGTVGKPAPRPTVQPPATPATATASHEPAQAGARSAQPSASADPGLAEFRNPVSAEKQAASRQAHAHDPSASRLEEELRRRYGNKGPAPKPVEIDTSKPRNDGDQWFNDADKLDVDPLMTDWKANKAENGELLRRDLSGKEPGAFLKKFNAASEAEKTRMRHGLHDNVQDSRTREWIEADPKRLAAYQALVQQVRPPNRSNDQNVETNKNVDRWVAAGRPPGPGGKPYEYDLIIVPGYTPLSEKVAKAGVHPTGEDRLQMAAEQYKAGKAPFVMLSGANVYPKGTSFYEAEEMKKRLVELGVPADRIIVDCEARHSTTNLRNCGRYMMDHNLREANVVTNEPQHFYMNCPDLSTYHMRSRDELGYEVGTLEGMEGRDISFKPSRDCYRTNFWDPLDP